MVQYIVAVISPDSSVLALSACYSQFGAQRSEARYQKMCRTHKAMKNFRVRIVPVSHLIAWDAQVRDLEDTFRKN